ncbi:PepSY-associated TM helix domain-containing protein [Thermomonas brevis]|uniref:PepSY-associated TM helix domain-containing protein n=1 Tax=Thermomonas brevis TaxID=215691 RepID=A0A7G9QUU6_9GAMM|nr:PepSY-associated TM helix domain-containing protein [Thermomonas brevis]QNN47121.1 PepSY-associated TM helix domain-containing protein [Thermomonas brevis]
MTAANPLPDLSARQRRGYWLRTLHQWHWISAAVCLVGMLLFAVTGITLNHAAKIEATPVVVHVNDVLPAALLKRLPARTEGNAELPAPVVAWLREKHGIVADAREAEWSEDEIYLSMPGPGHDAWLSIQKEGGALEYERTDRGTLAFLNDLHKGRNAGAAWSWFIDLFAVACIVFTATGLFLLWLHARQRRATWPLVALGLLIPMLLALLFIH